MSMLPLALPVIAAGLAVTIAAAAGIVGVHLPLSLALQVIALFLATALLDAVPIDIRNTPLGSTSLANVVIVGAAVIVGWRWAVLIAVAVPTVIDSLRRRRPFVVAYNAGAYGLAAVAAGGAASPIHDGGLALLIANGAAAAACFYVVDLLLVTAAIARSSRRSFATVAATAVRSTAAVTTIMGTLTIVLLVLWDNTPYAALLLIGPLAAVALHQRSTASADHALRLAFTDALTGLGNHRAFHERITKEIDNARTRDGTVTLCLLDIDNFKEINDRHGHPAGDRVLAFVAQQLRRDGEAFRIGGDEFALVLIGRSAEQGLAVARSVDDRVRAGVSPTGDLVQVSYGAAAFPQAAANLEALQRAADRALYAEKARRVKDALTSLPGRSELPALGRLQDHRDREARLRAAASLAHAVDARDSATGRHSWMVGELAARIALTLGLEVETAELARIAGRLHDLGKLAIPEEILRKPDALTNEERDIIERHAEIGFRILDALDVEPIAHWVLHHHERWDGLGYPDGLAGETIPLGARILFVADSFDAMTQDRIYHSGMSAERAALELEQCAGTQFDPDIVARFVELIRKEEIDVLRKAGGAGAT